MLTSIDAYGCDPAKIRSKEELQRFVIELCDLLKMKRFGPTSIEHFGESEVAGYTVAQMISTSMISAHLANKTNAGYFDLFSCKEYDPAKAAKFTADFFKSKTYDYQVLLRGATK
jgi:S-adenosylmethionine/arginine decarboxylase-like enzyme